MSSPEKVIVFGGQGSPHLFSSRNTSTAVADSKSSVAAAILLSRCHAAFLHDLRLLTSTKSSIFGDNSKLFLTPESLLSPGPEFHDNPVVQGTTIAIHQLLRYLSYTVEIASSYENFWHQIEEVAGFCSGILPAAVVCASDSIDQFIEHATEAFRLALWTSYRSALYCERLLGRPQKNLPWSLVVYGLDKDEVSASIEDFRHQTGIDSLNIAVVTSEFCITLSGPGVDLKAFKDHCSAATSSKFAHVHTLYHGGEKLQSVVQQILSDVKGNNVRFPSFTDLKKPLRSNYHEGFLSRDNETTFVESVLRSLLVTMVDWKQTSKCISNSTIDFLEKELSKDVEILSFGPSSNYLLSEIRRRRQHPRMKVVDVSQSKSTAELPRSDHHEEDVAIVGMAINYPRGASCDELWETLADGLSACGEIPGDRFDVSQFHDSGKSQSGQRKMSTTTGNFIDDPWSFDSSFFNISAREARSMDPQSRVLLQVAHAAMEDAGYVEDTTPTFQRHSFGCYVGAATGDYTDNLRNDIDVYYSPGTLRAFLSGKISYNYGLSGPSVVTDTACSSSLAAIYQACRALNTGDCTAAIAGGVNIITSPDMYLGLHRAHFLSPSGQCKSFDAQADGYSRAEGCGLFVLKKLSDAIKENDRIHGVIRGIDANQSGNAQSITHPHAGTQADLFRKVMKRAHVEPKSINVVEAHGTGTQAGDFSEISSLHSVFAQSRRSGEPLIVSSIKGNIGHSEAASGSAGLAKLVLMLRQGKIPKQASLNTLNPRLSAFIDNGITIPRTTQEWKYSPNSPRRALLNNFGAAGSNVALVLEEFVDNSVEVAGYERSSYIFNVSARHRSALEKSIHQYKENLLVSAQDINIADVCYTATARRQNFDYRVSFACRSIEDLVEQLDGFKIDALAGQGRSSSIVFVFSGQGASHVGMGKELLETSPYFRDCVQKCEEIVQNLGFPNFTHILQGGDTSENQLSESDEIVAIQCACVVIEYALARLWMSWNIKPDVVIGHSLGEYAALAISGAVSLEEVLLVVATRARLMTTECKAHASGMLACRFSTIEAKKLFDRSNDFAELTVACHNSTKDCVVAGPLDRLDIFQDFATKEGHKTTKLSVPYAFHSAAMDPLVQPLEQLGKTVKFFEPTIPLVSNVHGRLIGVRDLDYRYFASHARKSVRFADSITNLQRGKVTDGALFLEMGPHPITLPMIKTTLQLSRCTFLPTLSKDRDAWSSLTASLRQVFPLKDRVLWRNVFDGTQAVMIDLPGHPMFSAKACVPYNEDSLFQASDSRLMNDSKTGFSLLPDMINSNSDTDTFCFETHLANLAEYILGHAVGQTPMCPASVLHELVVEAAHSAQTVSDDEIYSIHDMVFSHPLVYDAANEQQALRVVLEKVPKTPHFRFKVKTQAYREQSENVHCEGMISVDKVSDVNLDWVRKEALVERQKSHLLNNGGHDLNSFQTRMLYQNVFSRVVDYSELYQSLITMSVSQSSGEGYGSFRIPRPFDTASGLTSPVFTDTLLHAAGFLANTSVRQSEACICGKVESIHMLYREIDFNQTFTVYCSTLYDKKGTLFADAYAQDSTGKLVAVLEGMHFRKVRLASFKAALGRSTQKAASPQEPDSEPSSKQNSSAPSTPTKGSSSPSTPVEVAPDLENVRIKIIRVISEVCEVPKDNVAPSTDLKSLGIDSLMILELITAINKTFPNQDMDEGILMRCSTIADLEKAIIPTGGTTAVSTVPTSRAGTPFERSLEDDVQHAQKFERQHRRSMGPGEQDLARLKKALEQKSPILTVSKGTSKSNPLYLFHDGSGMGTMYSKIEVSSSDVYSFNNPGYFDDNNQPSSLVAMAEGYTALLSAATDQSIIVGGYSFGGVLAFEAAHQLHQQGREVKGIILIDSPYPVNHEPLPDEVIAHVSKAGSSATRQRVAQQFQANAALLAEYQAPQSSHPFKKVVMLRSRDTFDCERLCGVHYPWLSDQNMRSRAVEAWKVLIGHDTKVLEIPGNHFEAFTMQNISETSVRIEEAVAWINGD